MTPPTRREVLKTGAAAATAMAAASVFGAAGGTGRRCRHLLSQKGPVRIRYEEAGSGFPLLVIAGGGLNSSIQACAPPRHSIRSRSSRASIAASPRTCAMPITGQSSGPLEPDRPWDSFADDHLGLMDHLGIDKFMVMGFCIGGPFIWNLIKRAPDRVVAGVLAQPVGFRPEAPNAALRQQHDRLGSGVRQAPARDHHGHGRPVPDPDVPHQRRLRLHGDARFRAQLPDAGADHAG